jgi:hypothetical protein
MNETMTFSVHRIDHLTRSQFSLCVFTSRTVLTCEHVIVGTRLAYLIREYLSIPSRCAPKGSFECFPRSLVLSELRGALQISGIDRKCHHEDYIFPSPALFCPTKDFPAIRLAPKREFRCSAHILDSRHSLVDYCRLS